jgi:hypothetical protein
MKPVKLVKLLEQLFVTTRTSTRSAPLQKTQHVSMCKDWPAEGHTYAHHVTVEAVLPMQLLMCVQTKYAVAYALRAAPCRMITQQS